jgi:hypothetical protein
MQTKEQNWQERIKIWEGLENFREVLLGLIAHNLGKINQASLDKLFSGYGFKMQINRKEFLLNEIDKQISKISPALDLYQSLLAQKKQLEELDQEIIIKRETNEFVYEYILKNKETMVNLFGFVKIMSKNNKQHRALLSWQHNKRDPILFLAELVPHISGNPDLEKIYFHINLGGSDGFAVLEELDQGYRWTHCLKHDYPDLVNAEFGSVIMDKNTKNIRLEDGNLAAATALSKAQNKNEQGITVLENNIALMAMYKKDLQALQFEY